MKIEHDGDAAATTTNAKPPPPPPTTTDQEQTTKPSAARPTENHHNAKHHILWSLLSSFSRVKISCPKRQTAQRPASPHARVLWTRLKPPPTHSATKNPPPHKTAPPPPYLNARPPPPPPHQQPTTTQPLDACSPTGYYHLWHCGFTTRGATPQRRSPRLFPPTPLDKPAPHQPHSRQDAGCRDTDTRQQDAGPRTSCTECRPPPASLMSPPAVSFQRRG
jgi:hypothetical protein